MEKINYQVTYNEHKNPDKAIQWQYVNFWSHWCTLLETQNHLPEDTAPGLTLSYLAVTLSMWNRNNIVIIKAWT